ncbi:hypothetical protein ACFLR3_00225 [Campylobacterota bacterium]
MFFVNVPQQCGCFRRSGKEASLSFESKDEALMHAQEMVSTMNDEFCSKHRFNVVEDGNQFIVLMGAGR